MAESEFVKVLLRLPPPMHEAVRTVAYHRRTSMSEAFRQLIGVGLDESVNPHVPAGYLREEPRP